MNEGVDDGQERERRIFIGRLQSGCTAGRSPDALVALCQSICAILALDYSSLLLPLRFFSVLYGVHDPTFAIDKARHLQIFNFNPVLTPNISLRDYYTRVIFFVIGHVLLSSRILFLTMKTPIF